MLRAIVEDVDAGAAANVGGPVIVAHKTFDLKGIPDLTRLEAYLAEAKKWTGGFASRRVIGVELVETN